MNDQTIFIIVTAPMLVMAILIVVVLIYGVVKWKTKKKRCSVYRVAEYETMEDFEKGLNRMATQGWEVDDWNTEPLYDWDAIQARKGGTLVPPGHSSFQVYRVVYWKEVPR